MSNSQIFAIICVIIIIVAGICVGIFFAQKGGTATNTTNEIVQNEMANNIVNELKQTNTIKNEIVNNEVKNTVETTQTKTETFTEKPKTQEEKAIQTVKKDYGEGNNLEFSVEGMDGKGRQIVVVRNSTTTEALAWYFVDVDNGTFDKQ